MRRPLLLLTSATCAAAALSAGLVVERLVAAGDAWADGAELEDDVTFVVLAVRPHRTVGSS